MKSLQTAKFRRTFASSEKQNTKRYERERDS